MNNPPTSVTAIADLLAWARRLTEAGRHADPAERAAYQTAKTNLLAHLTTHTHTHTDQAAQPDPRTPTRQETA